MANPFIRLSALAPVYHEGKSAPIYRHVLEAELSFLPRFFRLRLGYTLTLPARRSPVRREGPSATTPV